MAKQVKTRHYKPTAERKTKVIPIRVTQEQHDCYVKLAKRKGTGLSYWIRDALAQAVDAQS